MYKAAYKTATLLAALVAGGLFCGSSLASVGPQLFPNDRPNPSPDLPTDLSSGGLLVDPQLEVGGELGVKVLHRPAPAPTVTVPELSLKPSPTAHTSVYTEFTVGRLSAAAFTPDRPNNFAWRAPASTHFATESRFLRDEVVGPDLLDSLAERFDVNDDERPWSTTTTVHMLASTKDWLVPFATLAYEEDSLETYDRFGLGGGIQFNLDEHTTFGAEAIYFGDHVNDSLNRETRVLAKFEIDF